MERFREDINFHDLSDNDIHDVVDYWADGSVGDVRNTVLGDIMKDGIYRNGKTYPILYRYIECEVRDPLHISNDPIYGTEVGGTVSYNLISSTTMDMDKARGILGLGRYDTTQIVIKNARGLYLNDYMSDNLKGMKFDEQEEVVIYGDFRLISIERDFSTFEYNFHGENIIVHYDRYTLEQI